LTDAEATVRTLVADYPDATLSELCELLGQRTGKCVSRTALCRYVQKLGLTRKKEHGISSQAGTERVQKLRVEYWEKIRNIEAQNERVFRRSRDDAGFS
jgi:transposase